MADASPKDAPDIKVLGGFSGLEVRGEGGRGSDGGGGKCVCVGVGRDGTGSGWATCESDIA